MRKEAFWYIVSAAVSIFMNGEARCAASSSGHTSLYEQEEAVRGLIGRLLPEHQHQFRVHCFGSCGLDHHAPAFYDVHVSGGLVHIQGTSGKLLSRYLLACIAAETAAE